MARPKAVKSTNAPRLLRAFLCHASNDKKQVRDLYDQLKSDGVAPWLDQVDLMPGIKWEPQIEDAIRAADVVLICLSRRAVAKEGFVQKEVRYALDVAAEKPEGTIFLIPVRLGRCHIPASLRPYHAVNLYDADAYERQLLRALRMRAEHLGITLARDDALAIAGIVREADDVLRRLPPEASARETLTNLFRRLVSIDEAGNASRKAAEFEPRDPAWSAEAVQLRDAFINSGLLVTTRRGRPKMMQLAHENLLHNWHVLVSWILDVRFALLTVRRVEQSAREWRSTRESAGTDEQHEVDRRYLWPQETLDTVRAELELLGPAPEYLSSDARAFLRPEYERLLKELETPIGHERRAFIGDRLAQIGDPRSGVGVQDGLPDLVWCPVPAGPVTLRNPSGQILGTFDVEPFYIARYVVTLAQFELFTHPSVYYDKRWWSNLAVEPHVHAPFQQRPGLNQPAQFVSWYQAIAFCRWISNRWGCPVRLPTEWEWVQAATGGVETNLYPWGQDWDGSKANSRQGAYRLVAVGLYPNGTWPGGPYDMSGNVFEWCLNEFDHLSRCDLTGTNQRPTRGGAWFSSPEEMTVRFRLGDDPAGVHAGRRIAASIRLVTHNPPQSC